MINVGIVGATGYAGEELIDILLRHPDVRITDVSAKIDQPKNISEIFPRLKGRIGLVCAEPDLRQIIDKCDLVFLALPHTVSMEIAPVLLTAGKRVIDFSADYRLADTAVYTEFYKTKHKDKANIQKAVYGLPELYRQKIRSAQLIANPGCYPTAAILALAPLTALNLVDTDSIVIDAKSGVTGAGKKVAEALLFSEINEDFKAYKVDTHQHAPEINQELSKLAGKKLKTTFVPHLLPMNRGILETIYVNRSRKPQAASRKLTDLYRKFYKKEPFVRIREEGDFPRIKDVAGTNFCDIGIKDSGENVIIISVIDNLLKGASGQAVQNMNIMYKFPEHTALA
ncbi:MAG: N-acetyl-gamma-glutamyl-phosphate reductase [Candidatus Omnitrophica bacterium]|nr:N-acetyl-gamma-glutamyl-phosphate reductase [Candidatus Omnitrophota bacterium]MDD5553672.1 N-acetyl-gamma-glutamyl-phosphate reductase [Candidatus Omnitrophota bacterium]